MIERPLFAGLLFLLVACGPEVETSGGAGSGGGGGGSSTTGDTLSEGSVSSSGGESGCFTVVEGSLSLDGGTDLEWLSSVREVTGQLSVIGFSGTEDLRELRCLDSVGGTMDIRGNPDLESLAGLQMLREVNGTVNVTDNPRLRTLGVPLEKARAIQITSNPRLESLGLSEVRELGSLSLGHINCPEFPDEETGLVPVISGDNPLIERIDGFDNLNDDTVFIIAGQSGFISAEVIAGVTTSYKQQTPDSQLSVTSTFWSNPELSESEILEVFEAEGRESYGGAQACENRDDDRECECSFGG